MRACASITGFDCMRSLVTPSLARSLSLSLPASICSSPDFPFGCVVVPLLLWLLVSAAQDCMSSSPSSKTHHLMHFAPLASTAGSGAGATVGAAQPPPAGVVSQAEGPSLTELAVAAMGMGVRAFSTANYPFDMVLMVRADGRGIRHRAHARLRAWVIRMRLYLSAFAPAALPVAHFRLAGCLSVHLICLCVPLVVSAACVCVWRCRTGQCR